LHFDKDHITEKTHSERLFCWAVFSDYRCLQRPSTSQTKNTH